MAMPFQSEYTVLPTNVIVAPLATPMILTASPLLIFFDADPMVVPSMLASVIFAQPRMASVPLGTTMVLSLTVNANVLDSSLPSPMNAERELTAVPFEGDTSAVTFSTVSSPPLAELIQELPMNARSLTVREMSLPVALIETLDSVLGFAASSDVIVTLTGTSTASSEISAITTMVSPLCAAVAAAASEA